MNLGEHLKESPAPREMKHVSQMDPEELIHEFQAAAANMNEADPAMPSTLDNA